MALGRRIFALLAIFVVAALPAALAFLYYHFTQNPLMQPLGITREKLAAVEGQTEFVSIVVQVDWGQDRDGGVTQAEFRETLTRAFATRTDEVVFRFSDVPGKAIGVTYVVGPNRFGPYPLNRAVDGIVPATVALAMTKEFREKQQAAAAQ